MDQFAIDKAHRRRNKRGGILLAVLLSSSLATLGAGAMSLAVFTDSDASSGAWTAGTIILGVSPATTFSATGIMPGASGTQTVAVANTGTGDARYAISSVSTNVDLKGLRDQLTLTIRAGTCLAPGATLYTGALNGAVVGSNVQGADPGDRAVAAGATDNLCFAWAFPLTSGNTFQSAATSATFTFDSEQTANN
jgi:hypothetical protein